jgi:rod shape-determining protein MreD
MRWFWILAWTYLIFVLHTGLVRSLAAGGCTPHLVLAGLVLMSLRTSGREGLALAAGWGLLSDCLADGRLGPEVVAFVLATFVISHLSRRWNLKSPVMAGAAACAIVWGTPAISAGLRMFPDGRNSVLAAPVWLAAGSALYTGILVAAVTLAARLIVRSPAGVDPATVPKMSNKWRMLTE